MGLDVLLYEENGAKRVLEISEKLHKAIFRPSTKWDQFRSLRPIKDYYKANASYENEALEVFRGDLRKMSDLLSPDCQKELVNLVESISRADIKRVRVTGD